MTIKQIQILKKPINTAIILLILCSLMACNNGKTVYNQYKELPLQGWNKDSVAHFQFEITDTQVPYTLLLNLRHESNYNRQNLWLFTSCEQPDGTFVTDTLNIMLADNTGKWLGSGFASLRQMLVLVDEKAKFPQAGTYQFRVKQGMRDSILSGISDIGLEVIKN